MRNPDNKVATLEQLVAALADGTPRGRRRRKAESRLATRQSMRPGSGATALEVTCTSLLRPFAEPTAPASLAVSRVAPLSLVRVAPVGIARTRNAASLGYRLTDGYLDRGVQAP